MWDDPGTGSFVWNESEKNTIEAQYGKVGLVHFGMPWGAISLAPLKLAAAHGGTPFLDVGNETTTTTTSILEGKRDAALAQMDKVLREYGKEVILRPLWEMNGNWYSAWGQKANYAAAWRYMRSKLTAPNVKWLWCPNYFFSGSSGGAVDPTPYYPGDAYVDYVGADIYMENWSAKAAAEPILSTLKRIAPAKPVIVGEWGVSKSKNSNRPATIKEFFSLLPTGASQVYFNWNDSGTDWRLDDAASQAAYKAGIGA